MADYREHNNALCREDRQNTVVASLNQLNDQYTRAKTERIQKETLYKQIEGITASSTAQLDAIPAIMQSGTVQTLRQRVNELQRRKVELNQHYSENHSLLVQ